MAKRSADVQLEKTGFGFQGDGSQGSGPDPNMSQKATAAQMAKRKVASGRRPAGGQARAPNSFHSSPAPPSAATNGNNFQQNGNVGGGLFGQQGFAPPSTAFNFSSNNSFNFGAAAGTPAPMFGSSANQSTNSGTAGYSGSLFNLPPTTENRRNSQTGNLYEEDPNRKLQPAARVNDDGAPQWAESSPFHSKTPAIDAITGTTAATAGMSQSDPQQMNAGVGMFGQTTTASSSFQNLPFTFGNNASSPSTTPFGQSQPAFSSSSNSSAPSFGQNIFAKSNNPTTSTNLFSNINTTASSNSSDTNKAAPSNMFSKSASTLAASSQPFTWPPQQQTSPSTSLSGTFGGMNAQTSSALSSSNHFGGFKAGASSQENPMVNFGSPQTSGANDSPQLSKQGSSGGNARTDEDDGMLAVDMSPGEAARHAQQQGNPEVSPEEERLEAYQQGRPAAVGTAFSHGNNASQLESSVPPTNIFGSIAPSPQSQPTQSLFANVNTQKASLLQEQQSLFSKSIESTQKASQPQGNLFSGNASFAAQPPQPNVSSGFTFSTPNPSQTEGSGDSKSQKKGSQFFPANSGGSDFPPQQGTSLFKPPSQTSPLKSSLKQPTFAPAAVHSTGPNQANGLTATPLVKGASANNNFTSKPTGSNATAPQLDSAVLQSIKVQCITSIPQNFPEGLSESQAQQFLLGYRMRCLEKGLRLYVASLLRDKAEIGEASSYYQTARDTIFSIAGVKRNASNAGLYDGASDQNKRVNVDGPVTNGIGSKPPMFGFPTAEKRKTEDERTQSPKKSKADDVSYPSLVEKTQSSSSQTSRLFANLTSAANNSAIIQSPATPSKSTNNTSSLFSTTPAHPPPAASIFGSSFKGGSAPSKNNNFPPKASSFGRTLPTEPPKVTAPASGTNFLSQFGKKAQLTEAEEKAKRKAEDFDSEEETEEQWEKRDAEAQRKKKQALTSGALKVPSFGSASSSRSTSPAGSAPTTASTEGFLAQFSKKAEMSEAEEKAKRKVEDFDSEEETEAEWERRDAEEQKAKKKKLLEQAKAEGFKLRPSGTSPALSAASGGSVFSQPAGAVSTSSTPNMLEHMSQAGSDAEGSKTGDADNEDSYEEEDEEDAGHGEANEVAKAVTAAPGRSLFDRIERDADGNPKKNLSGFQAINASNSADERSLKAGQPEVTKRSSSEQPQASPFSSSITTFGATASIPKAGMFTSQTPKSGGLFSFSTSADSTSSLSPKADHTWKPESPIKFGTSTSAAAPSINFTSPSPTKPTEKSLGGLFGIPKVNTTTPAPMANTSTFVNPFAHLTNTNAAAGSPASSVGFNFGSPAASKPALNSGSLAPTSILASATTSRATTPGMTTGEESTGEDTTSHNDEPQLDLSSTRSGEEDEDVLFEAKSKALEFASPAEEVEGTAKEWLVRGVGSMRVLKNKDSGKVRMVLRAGPTGKVILNCGLMKGVKYENPTKKSVSFLAVGRPGAKLGRWTLQVGKEVDATTLKELLEKEKGN